MAESKVVIKVETKTDESTQSIKGLKKELKEVTTQLYTLKEGSKAFNDAAEKAGKLREKIRGVADAIDDADPEKAFGPFSRTIAGLAGGFSAAKGAMALFGDESKNLEKTLVQVQGAMALSEGINSLIAFKNDFKELGGIIVKQVVKAFTTLKGAIAATGIGLLVVTIGTLITNWKAFSAAITNAFPSFKIVTDFFSNLRQIGVGTLKAIVEGFKVIGDVVTKIFQRDFAGAIKSAKTFGEKVAIAYNEGYAEEDRKIKIENGLKDRKFALDLEEAKGKDVRAKRIQLMKDELSILEKGSEEYNAKLIEIETLRTEIRKENVEKEKERIKKLEEAEKKALEDKLARLKLELEANSAASKLKVDIARDEYNKLKEVTDKQVAEIEKQQKTALDYAANEKNSFADRRATLEEYLKAGIISQQQYADASVKITEQEQAAKLAIYSAVGNALSGLGQLVGEQTAAGKSLAVAQATIDTYVGATKAYAQGGVLGFISAAAVVAAGLANVRKIVATKIPGQSSGGGGGSFSAPQAPQFNPALATQVQGAGDVTLGPKPVPQKVYVVESDIRGVQNKVAVIDRNATIG